MIACSTTVFAARTPVFRTFLPSGTGCPREHNRRAVGNGCSLALQGSYRFQSQVVASRSVVPGNWCIISVPAPPIMARSMPQPSDSFWSQNGSASSRRRVIARRWRLSPPARHGASAGIAPGRGNVPAVLVIQFSRYRPRPKAGDRPQFAFANLLIIL